MRRTNENQDIRALERELNALQFRYHLAIKDGALHSIVADVTSRIAELEEKIERLKNANEKPRSYFDGESALNEEQPFASNSVFTPVLSK